MVEAHLGSPSPEGRSGLAMEEPLQGPFARADVFTELPEIPLIARIGFIDVGYRAETGVTQQPPFERSDPGDAQLIEHDAFDPSSWGSVEIGGL